MEYQEAIKIRNRMTNIGYDGYCQIPCSNCCLNRGNNGHDINCRVFEVNYPDEAESKMEEWAKAHPLKTRLTVFKEQYPDCGTFQNGTPIILPCNIDKNFVCKKYPNCGICEQEFWNEEIE